MNPNSINIYIYRHALTQTKFKPNPIEREPVTAIQTPKGINPKQNCKKEQEIHHKRAKK